MMRRIQADGFLPILSRTIQLLSPEGQVAVSRVAQINMAGYDTLGVCVMAGFGFALEPTLVPELINAQYGWGVGDNYLREVGRQTILLEREFNRRAGFTEADDRIPAWMTRESLPPTHAVFDVADADLDSIFEK